MFRRRIRPASQPAAPPAFLTETPLSELAAELRRRGFAILPRGVWESTVGQLEQRAAAAEAALQDVVERQRRMVAGTELVRDLGRLAGEELPRAAAACGELMTENVALAGRAGRAEAEAGELRAILVEDAIRRFQSDD
jgi:hypothetical protein